MDTFFWLVGVWVTLSVLAAGVWIMSLTFVRWRSRREDMKKRMVFY